MNLLKPPIHFQGNECVTGFEIQDLTMNLPGLYDRQDSDHKGNLEMASKCFEKEGSRRAVGGIGQFWLEHKVC